MKALEDIEQIGREKELTYLKEAIDKKQKGIVLIKGSKGSGGTKLLKDSVDYARSSGSNVVYVDGELNPYNSYQKLYEGITGKHFENEKTIRAGYISLASPAGVNIAESGSLSDLGIDADNDIFSGMLSAVDNFCGDSFDKKEGDASGGLGNLEYKNKDGSTTNAHIDFINAGNGLKYRLLCLYVSDQEFNRSDDKKNVDESMTKAISSTVKNLEKYNDMFKSWDGHSLDLDHPVIQELNALKDKKYSVRKKQEEIIAEQGKFSQDIKESLEKEHKTIILKAVKDEASLKEILSIGRSIEDYNATIIFGYMPEEIDRYEVDIRTFEKEGLGTTLNIEDLSKEDTKKHVSAILNGIEIEDEFIEMIYEKSNGNPLFIRYIVENLKESGYVRFENGEYVIDEFKESALPSNIKESVLGSIENLTEEEMRIIDYAATLSRSGTINIELLSKIMNIDESKLNDMARSLQDKKILIKENGNFSMIPTARDAIYEDTSNYLKKLYNRKIGESLEGTDDIFRIAHHFGESNDEEKCIEYGISAGDKAWNSFLSIKSLEFYDHALNKMRKKSKYKERLVQTLEKTAEVANMVNLDKAAELATEFVENAPEDKLAKALSDRGRTYFKRRKKGEQNDLDLAIADYQKALELYKKANDSRNVSMIFSEISYTYLLKGEFETGKQHAENGLSIAIAINDKEMEAKAHQNLGPICREQGNIFKYIEHLKIATKIYEEINHPNTDKIYCSLGIAYSYMAQSKKTNEKELTEEDIEEAFQKSIEASNKAIELAKSRNNSYVLLTSMSALAETHYQKNELEIAEKYAKEAYKMAKQSGSPTTLDILDTLGNINMKQGNKEKALKTFGEVVRLSDIYSATAANIQLDNAKKCAELFNDKELLKKIEEKKKKLNHTG